MRRSAFEVAPCDEGPDIRAPFPHLGSARRRGAHARYAVALLVAVLTAVRRPVEEKSGM